MAYPPGQSITVQDGGVGLAGTAAALPLVVGFTSAGTADTLYQYTDPNELSSEQGYGPAVGEALAVLNAAGGVLLLVTDATTVGVSSAVTPTYIGSATGTITLAGAPFDSHDVIVEITATGTLGTARFKYTLDAYSTTEGYTWSEEITIPAGGDYLIPGTNVTATFVPGAGPAYFDDGDTHRWTDTNPQYTVADLGTAWTALQAQLGQRKIRQVHFSGKSDTAADAATLAASIATQMQVLEGLFSYARASMDAGDDTAAAVLTAFASFADSRVLVAFGDAATVAFDSFAGRGVPSVPAAHVVAERAAGAILSENLGRFASGVLRGVRAISEDEGKSTAFSESDKITTLRTYWGLAGFYITSGYLRSPAGSDFQYWDWGRVLDEACETVHEALQRWINASLRAKTDGTGNIDPRDQARIEAGVRAQLKARLLDPANAEGTSGHVSAVSFNIDGTTNFLSTRTVKGSVNIVPLPPAETIETTVGFARSIT